MARILRSANIAFSFALLSPSAVEASPVRVDSCYLEEMNGLAFGGAVPTASVNADLELRGWLVDQRRATVPLDAWIAFVSDGRTVALPLRRRVMRRDIMTHFANEDLMLAGFVAKFPARILGVGTWYVTLHYRTNGSEFVCDNGRAVALRGGAE